MQAVILSGGKGTRMGDLCKDTPKALIDVNGKPIIHHQLDVLKGLVDEVIIVIGYLGDKIKEFLGDNYNGIHLVFVKQEKQRGTGDALLTAKPHLKDKFILMYGDDIYSRHDLSRLLENDRAILGLEVEHPETFGVFEIENGNLKSIHEKPENPPSNIVNTGCYVLDTSIFEHELVESPRGELEATDYINYLIDRGDNVVVVAVEDNWIPINNPAQLDAAKKILKGD